jgi:hypothetical protein
MARPFRPELLVFALSLIAVGVAWLLGNAGRIDLLATLRAWWPLTLVVPDAQVNLAAFQQRHLGRPKGLGQPDLHVGEAHSVSGQKGRQNTLDHLRRGRHLQHAAVSATEQFCALAQRTDLAQDAAAISEQLLADGCQDETAPHAIKEPDAELLFEIADLPRQGRLADTQM